MIWCISIQENMIEKKIMDSVAMRGYNYCIHLQYNLSLKCINTVSLKVTIFY